jgi:hypothetical protein
MTYPYGVEGGPAKPVEIENASIAVTGTFYPSEEPVSVASGKIASGAIASGAVASGAVAAGAIATGAIVDLGTTITDAAASNVVEDTTAKTGIGLFKGIKNLLKLINDKLVSGTDIGDVTINNAVGAGVYVQPGTSAEFATSLASGKVAAGAFVAGAEVDGHSVTLGLTTATPAVAVEDGTARGIVSLLKGIKNILYNAGAAFPVKGTGFSIYQDLTVDATAYGIGDVLATVATFANAVSANGKRSVIHTINLDPNGAMPAIAFNLWFFSAAISGAPAKNAPFVLAAADTLLKLGSVPIMASDYLPTQENWNCACLRSVGLEFQGATTSIYAYLVATAVTAPVATSLRLTITGEQLD